MPLSHPSSCLNRVAQAAIAILLFLPAVAGAQLAAVPVAEGLSSPLGFVQVPTDSTAQVILEQGGRVRLLKDGHLQDSDYLDLSGVVRVNGEQGLLGLAFSPSYASDHRVFVNFIDGEGHTVVARFLAWPDDLLHANPESRFDLVWPGGAAISRPSDHHNGGNMAFGPDGYLYIGLGDGDEANDPQHLAQDPQSLLGKMLRVNVAVGDDDAEGYDVPPDNPFVARDDVLPEIWAMGLRNPWRWSFDDPARGGTGALIIGDVGQDAWEEVDYQPNGAGGRNYGWRNREGAHDNVTDLPPFSDALIEPLIEYGRDQGHSIVGGIIYRGQALPSEYRGRYFFGDFVAGQVWSLGLTIGDTGEASVGDMQRHPSLAAGALELSSFGVDAAGELYLVSYADGTVSRIVDASSNGGGGGGCAPPDPYAGQGGGTCDNGRWVPPLPVLPVNGDFDGDSRPDIVWENIDGLVYLWRMNGTTFTTGAFLSATPADPEWQVVGTSDLTGDGKPDLLWQHQQTGQVKIVALDGTTVLGEQVITMAPNTPWRIVGTGDFNRDGKADIVWENASAGTIYIWFMASPGGVATFQSGAYVTNSWGGVVSLGPNPTWHIVGAADLNRDGYADLIWRDAAGGFLAAWYMQDAVSLQGVDLSPSREGDMNWQIRAVGDYNGDGHPDLIWQNVATGGIRAWLLDDVTALRAEPLQPSQVNLAWHVVGTR